MDRVTFSIANADIQLFCSNVEPLGLCGSFPFSLCLPLVLVTVDFQCTSPVLVLLPVVFYSYDLVMQPLVNVVVYISACFSL